jgi:hypothetical protein
MRNSLLITLLAGLAAVVGVAQVKPSDATARPQPLAPSAPAPAPAVRINEDPFYDPSAPERVASSKPLHPSLNERIAAWESRKGPKAESEKYLVEEIQFTGLIATPEGFTARVAVKGVSDIFSISVGSRLWNGQVAELRGFERSGKSPQLVLMENQPKQPKQVVLELHPKSVSEGGKNAF